MADSFADIEWKLKNDSHTYVFADRDDQPWEKAYKHLGRTFPHALGPKGEDLYAALRYTPMGDELTLDFAKELIVREMLGQGRSADLLAVSFSCTDYIGHAFGPDSLEG